MKYVVLSNFAGIGVTILTFAASQVFVPYYSGDQQPNEFLWAFISLLLGLLADRIVSSVAQKGAVERQKAEYARVIESVRGAGDVQAMSASSALDYHLPERLKSAVTVNNTLIGGKLGRKREKYADQKITALYDVFFKTAGNSWTDTISIHELQSARFRNIARPDRENIEHKLIAVRHNMPMINFTILDFPENEREPEVFFGWNYSSDANSDTVFHTKNKALVEAFRTLSSSLKEYSLGEVALDYSKEPARRTEEQRSFIDKEGNWLTLSYRNDELVSLASISITFSQHLAKISGRVFWRKGYSPTQALIEEINHQDDGKVSYTDTKMLVEYTSPLNGVCIYNFKDGEPLERITGYFQNENQAFRTNLIGFKIRPDQHVEAKQYALRLLAAKSELNSLAKTRGLTIDWSEFDFDGVELPAP